MKIRLDFVTNSSSSSFTCVALYSEELYNFLQNLIAKKRYVNQPGWTWSRPEEELHLQWRWEELKFDSSWNKIQVTEEYGSTDKESIFKYICYFFEGLTEDEKESLKKLVFEVYKAKEYQTHKYKDYTDGYVGFDFRGKLTKADLEGGSKKEKIQELLMKIGDMAVDPRKVDLSMKTIGVQFSKIDGHGAYDPKSTRYEHIDKRFLNRVRVSWDSGFDEEYNRYQLEEERRSKWGEFLRTVYDDAIDDVGAIALRGFSPRFDYVLVMDSIDTAVEDYIVKGFMNEHGMSKYGDLSSSEGKKLDILTENYFIGYLKSVISFVNEANKERGAGEGQVSVILESQLHDYLMNNSSLGNITPKPVVGLNGTVRQKIPKGLKNTIDRDISELFARWPSRVVNPKTRTFEKIAKDIEDNREKLGYAGIEEFLDAYGLTIKQEAARKNVNKYGDFEFEKTKKTNEVSIVKYVGTDAEVVIPNAIDGAPVKTIGTEAFCRNKSIEEVFVPDTVVTMRGKAFSFCGNLKKVRLSNNISKIVAETFDGCGMLEEINIPDMVQELPSGLFKDCPIKRLHIGKSLDKIDKNDFFRSELVEENNISHGFAKTCALESVSISTENRSLKAINSMVLSKSGKILYAMLGADTSCRVPDGVEIIADSAFVRQGFLKEVAFPESLRLIGNKAFEYTDLESIAIPGSVKIIGANAFHACRKLTNVIFSEGLEEIYNEAFFYTGIRKVVFPSSLKKLGKYSFDKWDLETVEPREWERVIRRWGDFSKDSLNTQKYIQELESKAKQAAVDAQLDNKIGFGLLGLMMACLHSEDANTFELRERLRLEQVVISKEMESILGTDLKLVLSFYKDRAVAHLNECIKHLKVEADKDAVRESLIRIKEAFPQEQNLAVLLEKIRSNIGEEA